ncbi:tRNA pseudouridine(38-40) synthase TruA [Floccifex sp.]|uniref:tRNA pseudouridine(38-40) synthase TruA n=1 Tax=Floccifex sp. TaxID=2815810 RepID=UPI003F0CD656
MILKVTVSYDGFDYAGWQRQENALGIQEVIENCLSKIHKTKIEIVSSGRTDAKVHALGQVFHFEPKVIMPCQNVQNALNTLLPDDIRVLKVEEVDDSFHARFSAKSKRYDFLCTYDVDNPFIYRYAQKLFTKLDVQSMKEAAQYFIGEHDFTSFSSSKIDPRKPRIKTVSRLDIYEEDQNVRFVFEGNGFLRYQVRMMTGTLIAVGRHQIEIEDVNKMLMAKNKDVCRYNAHPHGLYLVEVKYE